MKKLISFCILGLLSVILFSTSASSLIVLEDANNLTSTDVSYQFMSHLATAPNVQCSGTEPLTAAQYFPSGNDASLLNVMTYIKTVPVEFKSTY